MQCFKNIIFLLFIIFASVCGNAQSKSDSLWGVWKDNSKPDTSRLMAIDKIIWKDYLFRDQDSAYILAQNQYDFAKSNGVKNYMIKALRTQGISFDVKGDGETALEYYYKGLEIAEESGDLKGKSGLYHTIGMVLSSQGNYNGAKDYYLKSINIKKELGDHSGTASTLNNLGVTLKKQGDLGLAAKYYTEALKLHEEAGEKKGMSTALGNIGMVNYLQNNFDKAADYFQQALDLSTEINYKKGIANNITNLGNVDYQKGKIDVALVKYHEALEIRHETNDKWGEAIALHNIANIYGENKEYDKALEYFNKSIKIRKEIDHKEGITNALYGIGTTYFEKNDYNNALSYFEQSLKLGQKIGALAEIRSASERLWNTYKKLNKPAKALEMHELYVLMKDSINREANKKEVIRQELKYEYEKQAALDSIAFANKEQIAKAKQAEANAEAKIISDRQQAEIERKKIIQYALFTGLSLLLVFAGFIFNRFKLTQKQKSIIEEQKEKVDHAYAELGEKNKEVMDSITYAKRIQNAILPSDKLIKKHLPNSFILYKPKDIVAGDFYWMNQKNNATYFAAADCTGHGVPGAMVSVICNNSLNRSLKEFNLNEPGKILDKTRDLVISEFEKSEEDVKDGMDIALCKLEGNELQYAGANNPLWIVRNGEIIETKANKQPIGKFEPSQPFSTHKIKLEKGDVIYIFSDGFVDQFGGDKGKKFKAKPFKELLSKLQESTMEKQKKLINETFENWKGDLEQIDDVCVIGVKI